MPLATNIRVGNLMSLHPLTMAPDDPAHEAEQLLKTYRISGVPVVEDGVVVGVLSQTDLLTARSSELISGNWPRLRVRHLMSRPAMSVSATDTVEAAARQMLKHHIHRLVVVDDADTPIGIVTPLDLLRVLLDESDGA